jgi:hypothetical protein
MGAGVGVDGGLLGNIKKLLGHPVTKSVLAPLVRICREMRKLKYFPAN